MVKNTRVTYRRRHCYNTKSNKIRKVKTPGTLPHQFLLVPFIPRLPFNCKTTKRDLFLLGEYIYPSKMARRGTNTDGVCNGRQWQCQMAIKGSLCVRNNGGNRICPDHQTLHTPMDYRTNPINFFNGGYGPITRHLQRNN